MDVKCVRVLRPYDDSRDDKPAIYIDEDARWALNKNWGDEVTAIGRRTMKLVIKPLKPMDQEGFVARANQAVIDGLFIEYGEEVQLR